VTVALLSHDEVDRVLAGELTDWSLVGEGEAAITREVRVETFLDGIALVRRVAEAAEEKDHHPDIDIRFTTLTFVLSTHSEGGLTAKDVDLAREIDRLAGP